jgi:hypothetical protein
MGAGCALLVFVYPHFCILPNAIAYLFLAAKVFVITVHWKLFPTIDDDAGWLFKSHIFSGPGLGLLQQTIIPDFDTLNIPTVPGINMITILLTGYLPC